MGAHFIAPSHAHDPIQPIGAIFPGSTQSAVKGPISETELQICTKRGGLNC
jgi:hypothetical protein